VRYLRILLLSSVAGLGLVTETVRAADEDVFLGQFRPSSEQTMGQGQSTLWTMPDVATQYQPLHSTPAMQAALQAQHEGRFLDALILLDEAVKSGQGGVDAGAEINLLRASFLLQGNQSRQAITILAPLLANTQHAADAYALTAMAHLQQGQTQEALEAAQHAHELGGGMLPHLALSYALQGMGRLAEAHDVMRDFNSRTPQAITLARDAELALTLDQIQSARVLVHQAQETEATHPYVIAVSGLVDLINGQAGEARAAFETALRRDPMDAKALLGLGLAEIKLGDLQDGQKNLQAANEAEPGNALILTYLGRAQQQAGQTEAAMDSWRSAQQADPRDPMPWLYEAQAELLDNRLSDARENLRQAQARTAYRSVYRSASLLREDAQLLQANLAEIQRRLGVNDLAFHTLTDMVGEQGAVSLRDQADALQGQRFGESARRSLLLQSLFNDRPGNLPAALDIYGDGAGQTGATTPQHGAVSGLSAEQASYNNYDALFNRYTTLEANAVTGSHGTNGEQIRLGVGNGTLGLGVAQRQYQTDGFAPFDGLDNRAAQAVLQWLPIQSTQAFVSYQTFHSQRGETFYPAALWGFYDEIVDSSRVTRLGLRHALMDNSELRALWSNQQTGQANNYEYISLPISISSNGTSSMHSAELQYRRSGATYATQWGVHQSHGQKAYPDSSIDVTLDAQEFYAAWQQRLSPDWQVEAQLGWGRMDTQDNIKLPVETSTSLVRWLPKLGVVYAPDAGVHVRFAAWRGMGVYTVGDASLAPATIAGLVLGHPDDNGKLVQAVNLSADRQLNSSWLLTAEVQQRKTDLPYIDGGTGQQILSRQQIDKSRMALHWGPEGKPWNMGFAYDHEYIRNDPLLSTLDSVDKQKLNSSQLILRWFVGVQWTANLAWSHNRVEGTQQTAVLPFPVYQDSFNQMDADLSWQFNGSRGALTAGVRNVANTRFQYADIDRFNPRFSTGRLVYAKLKLAW
jgi:tetratricopeptide (TPR) repeat protein